MLSARRAQKACPQCRAQLLTLFENGFAGPSSQPHRGAPVALKSRTKQARPFSTSRRRLQDAKPETSTQPVENVEVAAQQVNVQAKKPQPVRGKKPSDVELVVRQAKGQFGDTLPNGYLNEEELRLYTRFYGAPLRETRPEDVGMPIEKALLNETHKWILVKNKNVLLREGEDGTLEEVEYHPQRTVPTEEELAAEAQSEQSALPSDVGIDYIKVVAKNQREFDALMKLQKDFETASLRATPEEDVGQEEPEEFEEFEEQEEDEGEPDAEFDPEIDPEQRVHPNTSIGQWGTNPRTIYLPRAGFVTPINSLLDRTDLRHVQEAAEKAFGGPGFPHSVATPASGKRQGQEPISMDAGEHRMSEIEADAYIATNLPGMYASVMSILVEVRKRMGPKWLQGLFSRSDGEGPRVLDTGAGGAGLAAWQKLLDTEWELLHGRDGVKPPTGPPGKKTVVVGSDHLRHRISRLLDNTSFLPRLPDYLHSGDHPEKMSDSELPPPRKVYDVIIASHQLMPLKESFKRKTMLENLWEMLSPEGGIIIFVEKGHPRGFEAVADVRHRLINEFIECPTSEPPPDPVEQEHQRVREPGMIIAPCTNHKKCPMYLTPGIAHGRKDFCHFSQRFIRPPFLQKILGASHRNHEDVDFSFVAVQRGMTSKSPIAVEPDLLGGDANAAAWKGYEKAEEQPNPLSLPRNIMLPIKRHGHVTLDLCTPAGTIERWTVPKSFSKQAYHDARKARWGDLWALGAKTRVVRPIRLGKGGVSPNDGGIRARRAEEAAKMKGKARVINLESDAGSLFKQDGKSMVGETVKLGGRGPVPTERRTKGGKKLRQRKVKDLLVDE